MPKDPELGWRYRPHFPIESSKGKECVNSLGWRGPEHDYERRDQRLRIACIGDSCTYGVHTPIDRETYPRQLEALLREQYGLHDAEVFNFATSGYGTFHGAALMKKVVPQVKPDFVIAYFGWNDRTRVVGWHDHREKINYLNSFWHDLFFVRLFLRWTDKKIVPNVRMSRAMRRLFGPQFLKHGQTLKEVEENTALLIQRCKEQQVPLILLTAPWGKKGFKTLVKQYESGSEKEREALTPSLTYNAYNIYLYNEVIRRAAQKEKVELIDLEALFLQLPEEELESYFYSVDVMHPNEKGCRLIAEAIAAKVTAAAARKEQKAHAF